jgi:hypothetical protein
MRRLGKEMAKNLDINYFDKANISMHHQVRHDSRRERYGFSLTR